MGPLPIHRAYSERGASCLCFSRRSRAVARESHKRGTPTFSRRGWCPVSAQQDVEVGWRPTWHRYSAGHRGQPARGQPARDDPGPLTLQHRHRFPIGRRRCRSAVTMLPWSMPLVSGYVCSATPPAQQTTYCCKASPPHRSVRNMARELLPSTERLRSAAT